MAVSRLTDGATVRPTMTDDQGNPTASQPGPPGAGGAPNARDRRRPQRTGEVTGSGAPATAPGAPSATP